MLGDLGVAALGIAKPQPLGEHGAAQVELLAVFVERDVGDVEPLAVLDPEGQVEPVRQVDERLVLHFAAGHDAPQRVVAPGRIGAGVVDVARDGLRCGGPGGKEPVSERAERLAQRLLLRIESLVDN